MTRVWGVLLVLVAASGCPPMQNMPVDGNDPSVAYLRDEVDEMHEKLAKQTDANSRFASEVKQLQDSVGTESGRITRVDQRVTSMLIDIGEVRARMELLEGSRKLSDRTISFLQTPIEFNYNTDELQKAGRRRIEIMADFLDINRDVQVVVVGFLPPGCPAIDAPECGEDPLVLRRVKTVLSRLEKSGVSGGERVGEEYVELPRGMQRDDVYLSLRTEGETPPPPTPRPDRAAPPAPGTTPPAVPAPGTPAPGASEPGTSPPAAGTTGSGTTGSGITTPEPARPTEATPKTDRPAE